ncbi:MAG: NAD(P)/FAD-dependent oxidoreductase, partial [Bacteroidota bacterium]
MKDVIIVGGGMAGLTAAYYLDKMGKDFLLLEASGQVGGRVKTDRVDGFLLDRGFQVLLTAYPEVKAVLDYDQLNLKAFLPGALILKANGRRSQIGDPLRWPSSAFSTLFSGIGNWGDKFNILSLRYRLSKLSIDAIFQQQEVKTYQALKHYGFSEEMIQTFFKPFLGGIFLERDLNTSKRMFDFVFKLFSEGDTAIPANGIAAIPQQLLSRLPQNSVKLHHEAIEIETGKVRLVSGEILEAKQILIATDAQHAAQLLRQPIENTDYESTVNVYFKSKTAPLSKPILALNATPNSTVNNCTVLSQLSDQFAPAGQHLISVSIIGQQQLSHPERIQAIKTELAPHFGADVHQWEHLRTYQVDYALPNAQTVKNDLAPMEIKLSD